MARDVVFVAGVPAHFPPDHPTEKYIAAYRGELGGLLVAVSAEDGSRLREIKLDSRPAWDGLAAADGALFIALRDGSVCRFSGEQ